MRPKTGVQVSVPSAGSTTLRLGLNNVDSSRTACLDQVIQMIATAEKNIFIRDQFLFERNVVLALLDAKKTTPQLEIKILLEPQPQSKPPGLPNILYADLLVKAGMQVRFKKLPDDIGPIKVEYHMKTISADGESLIAGSANKDQTTMYGAFREEQVDVFDAVVTASHDKVFQEQWTDTESDAFTGNDFAVPYNLKGPDGQPLTPDRFVSMLRNAVSILYDAATL